MKIDPSAVESFDSGRVCIMARASTVAVVDSGAHMYAFNNGSTTVRAHKQGKNNCSFP